MKVCISNKRKNISNPKTGKGYFVARLVKQFSMIGVEVTADPDCECDIYLGIGKFEHKHKKCKKRILRLGDVHKDTNENYKLLNKRKIQAIAKSDGVIYQSKYSKKLSNAFLIKAKCPTTVILNGADPNEFNVEHYPSKSKYNFIASTRKWTKQKRLKFIIEAFRLARISDSCLWICGDANGEEWEHTKGTHIVKLGVVKPKVLASLYRLCYAMIDITYLSACPNNVVEALVAGCPVIHTSEGGTNEVVNFNGFCIKDKKYNYTPINLNKPPKVSVDTLAKLIALAMHWKVNRPTPHYLNIQHIAKQYKRFFEKVLHE